MLTFEVDANIDDFQTREIRIYKGDRSLGFEVSAAAFAPKTIVRFELSNEQLAKLFAYALGVKEVK